MSTIQKIVKRMTYKCHYTGKEVSEVEVIWTGAIIPNVKVRVPCAPGYEPYRKESIRLFDESEKNCNTCKNLERVKHKKNSAGFLFGNCKKNLDQQNNHPYKHRKQDYDCMIFHPQDWMGMNCYESRYEE